jgi:hypothetical protein
MLRTTQDNNFCRAPWIGGAMPTLTYGFDKAYWAQCAAVPPFDTSLPTPAAFDTTLPSFVPCHGTSVDVENVDGTGAHGTRGVVTGMDGAAFMRQGAFDYAYSRAFAQNAIHAPFHFRSNRTRTRPGEGSADTANSVISLTMLPKAASAYDFTSDGLPIAVNAYQDGRTSSDFADGYVQAVGGYGGWSRSYPDSSHLYSYAYMSYLFDGSPWLLESGIIDWTMYSIQQQVGQNYARRPLLLDDYRAAGYAQFASMPVVTYTGISTYCAPTNGRAAAFAINHLGQAAGITPDAHEAARFLRLLNSHNGDWIAQSLQYMPASQKAYGEWGDITPTGNFLLGANVLLTAPWFSALITITALCNYRSTGVDGYRQLGMMTANKCVGLATQGPYFTSAYYGQASSNIVGPINFGSNDWVNPRQMGTANTSAATTSGSDVLTAFDQWNEGSSQACQLALAVGDTLRFTPVLTPNDSATQHPLPSGVSEGTDYFIVAKLQSYGGFNSNVWDQVRISATPGGAPIVFSSTVTPAALLLRPASASVSVATSSPLIPSGDTYMFLHAGALAIATKYGHASAAAALAKMQTFLAPASRNSYMPSALAVV